MVNQIQRYQRLFCLQTTSRIVKKQKMRTSLVFQVCYRVPHTQFRLLNLNPQVRNYVEGMKNSSELLDLLSATGSDELEPTRVVAERTALYTDVRYTYALNPLKFTFLGSIFLCLPSLLVSKLANSIKATSMPTNITTSRYANNKSSSDIRSLFSGHCSCSCVHETCTSAGQGKYE